MSGYLEGFRAGIEAAAKLVDRDDAQTPGGDLANMLNGVRENLAHHIREFGAKVTEGLDAGELNNLLDPNKRSAGSATPT